MPDATRWLPHPGPRARAWLERRRWWLRRCRDWLASRVLTGTRAVPTPYGFVLEAGWSYANRAMQKGTYEPEEVELLSSLLGGAEVFVDVGANVGFYVCLAGCAGVPVIAFEPQAQNLACLYANIRRNRLEDVEVFPLALGAGPGLVEIYGASGPSASVLRGWAGFSPRWHQTVPIHALDLVLGERLRGRRALIKIDVEGYEFEVLRGAQGILRSTPRPTWIVEAWLGEFDPSGRNPHYEELFAQFFEAGYRAFVADSRGAEVTRADVAAWARANRCPIWAYNFLFRSRDEAPGCARLGL